MTRKRGVVPYTRTHTAKGRKSHIDKKKSTTAQKIEGEKEHVVSSQDHKVFPKYCTG